MRKDRSKVAYLGFLKSIGKLPKITSVPSRRGLRMELVVDEFIIDWHLSDTGDQRQTAESIMRLVKKKCHRLVFDLAYLNRFVYKLGVIERKRKGDTYVTEVLVKRLRTLIYDSSKVRLCEGRDVSELQCIKDQYDRLVAKSALCVEGSEKLLVTTDSDLIGKANLLGKYKVKVLTPNDAEKLLISS
jgi:hypothetical protein